MNVGTKKEKPTIEVNITTNAAQNEMYILKPKLTNIKKLSILGFWKLKTGRMEVEFDPFDFEITVIKLDSPDIKKQWMVKSV